MYMLKWIAQLKQPVSGLVFMCCSIYTKNLIFMPQVTSFWFLSVSLTLSLCHWCQLIRSEFSVFSLSGWVQPFSFCFVFASSPMYHQSPGQTLPNLKEKLCFTWLAFFQIVHFTPLVVFCCTLVCPCCIALIADVSLRSGSYKELIVVPIFSFTTTTTTQYTVIWPVPNPFHENSTHRKLAARQRTT